MVAQAYRGSSLSGYSGGERLSYDTLAQSYLLNYDPAGDLTRDERFRQRAYLYDANNRQRQSSALDGTGAVRSVYDGAGQRVATQAGGGITAVMVYDAFGQLAAEYAPTVSTGGTRYVMADHQGTPRVVMNAAGADGGVVSRRDYLPLDALNKEPFDAAENRIHNASCD